MCRWRLLVGILLLAGPASALQRVYVANISGGSVAVVDAERRAMIGSIAVGRQPDGIAVSADGHTVWVANFGDATVSVIDTGTDTVVATIPVDLGPVGIAVHPNGHEVYVACKVARTVVVIDATTRTLAASLGVYEGPNDLAISNDGARLFVTRSDGNSVAIIDTATRHQQDPLLVGRSPNRLALSPDGTTLYVTAFRDGTLTRIVLAGAPAVVAYTSVRPTDVAVSADGRTVYVSAMDGSLAAYDATSLEPLRFECGGVTPYALLPMPGGALFVADMGGDALHVSGAGPAAQIPIDGGPFALAALAHEDPPLDLAIHSPAAGARPEPGVAVPVRMTAGDGSQPLTRWTLRLIGDAGAPGQVLLATGTDPVRAADVATIGAGTLLAGHSYQLKLEGSAADETHLVRTTPLFLPHREYALVPLEPTRGQPYQNEMAMDGSGRLFARFDQGEQDIALFDAVTGSTSSVVPPLRFERVLALQLSRDGTRLVMAGQVGDAFTFGLLDLDTSLFTNLPSYLIFDIDADAQHVATFTQRDDGWNYALLDVAGGGITAITDVPSPDNDLPPTCRPLSVDRPRLSADGAITAFFTTLPLGGPPGCDLYVYDDATHTRRFVGGFGDDGPTTTPSMDDAGGRLSILLPPLAEDAPTRLEVVDLADGKRTPLLAASGAAILDGVISGDGASVVLSSCADLDPSVGNPDFSQELFRLDLASGHVTQITDTRGGPQDCFVRDGEPFSPQVSRSADVVAFRGQGYGPLSCGNPGPQRDQHTGLAFGQARAVRIVDGNQPPDLSVDGSAVVAVGNGMDLFLHASDPEGDPLLYFADFDDLGGLPPAAAFAVVDDEEAFQARFSWFPGVGDVGEHDVRFGAFDGRGGDAVRSVRVSVCRFLAEDPIGDVVTAIFHSQPAACGSGDANGDGIASAADLVVRR